MKLLYLTQKLVLAHWKCLLDGDFLKEARKGFFSRSGDRLKSKITQYAATNNLLEYLKDVQEQTLFIPKPDTETIVLKAPIDNAPDQTEKALTRYPDILISIQMRKNLKLISENMLSHWYDLQIADDSYVSMQKEIAKRRNRNKQKKRNL